MTDDPNRPGPPREVQEDVAAREAIPESAGLRAIKVSRQLPYDQLESSFIQKFQVFLEREFLGHAEQARKETVERAAARCDALADAQAPEDGRTGLEKAYADIGEQACRTTARHLAQAIRNMEAPND